MAAATNTCQASQRNLRDQWRLRRGGAVAQDEPAEHTLALGHLEKGRSCGKMIYKSGFMELKKRWLIGAAGVWIEMELGTLGWRSSLGHQKSRASSHYTSHADYPAWGRQAWWWFLGCWQGTKYRVVYSSPELEQILPPTCCPTAWSPWLWPITRCLKWRKVRF